MFMLTTSRMFLELNEFEEAGRRRYNFSQHNHFLNRVPLPTYFYDTVQLSVMFWIKKRKKKSLIK